MFHAFWTEPVLEFVGQGNYGNTLAQICFFFLILKSVEHSLHTTYIDRAEKKKLNQY